MNSFVFNKDIKAHVRYMTLQGGQKYSFTFDKIPGSYEEFITRTIPILAQQHIHLENDNHFALISHGKVLNKATYFYMFRNRENPPTIIVTPRRGHQ